MAHSQWLSFSMSFYLLKAQNNITPHVWEILKGGLGREIIIYINRLYSQEIRKELKEKNSPCWELKCSNTSAHIVHSTFKPQCRQNLSHKHPCLWLSMSIWSCKTYFLWITIYLASLLFIGFLLLNIHLSSLGKNSHMHTHTSNLENCFLSPDIVIDLREL